MQAAVCDNPLLRLFEFGRVGRGASIWSCSAKPAEAQRAAGRSLRRGAARSCRAAGAAGRTCATSTRTAATSSRTLILGASNTWFPSCYSTSPSRSPPSGCRAWWQRTGRPGCGDGPRTSSASCAPSGQLGDLPSSAMRRSGRPSRRNASRMPARFPRPTQRPDLKAPEWAVFTQLQPGPQRR